MRNTTITYQGKEYYIGCNYRTKWQKSKDAHPKAYYWVTKEDAQKALDAMLIPFNNLNKG